VRKCIVTIFLSCNLIAFLCVGSSVSQPTQRERSNVKVTVEKVERVNGNEAHFWVKVVNKSATPVFIEAYSLDTRILEDLYLEQWREREGWHAMFPCLDMAPGGVMKLKPGDAISQEFTLTNPLPTMCKDRNTHFEGRYRFVLNFFNSVKDARTDEKNFFSSGQSIPLYAGSDPFEIPPPKK